MGVFHYFLRSYPRRTGVMLACLLLAALADGIGISTLLPVLSLATAGGGADGMPTAIEIAVLAAFDRIGLAPELPTLLAVIALAFWTKAALSLVAKREVGYGVARIATDLRLDLLRGLLGARWAWFTHQPHGAIANAMATEATRASESYRHMALVLAFSIEALVYAGVALAISWRATLAAGLAGAATLVLLSRFVRMSSRAGEAQTHLLRSLIARLEDTLGAARLLKATGHEDTVGPLLVADTEALDRAMRRRVLGREALRALQEPILLTLLCAGLYVALAGLGLPMTQVFVLVLLFARLLARMSSVQTKFQLMLAESSALFALRSLTERAIAERETGGGSQLPSLHHAIALRDVVFAPDGRERPVLDHVSLELPAREITVLTGDSGAGKTTVVDLLTGLVEPDAGDVCIDDVPLARIDMRRWRERIGYVPQETLLLRGSVRSNVTFGDPDLDDGACERALRAAGAWEFVTSLPEGLDAPVGERGTLLSGGERQRIAIARALVREPWLLILDEATAGLDAESADAVWQSVEQLRGAVTVVAISHGPAAIRIADHVWRLEAGRVRPRPRQVA